MTMIRGAVVGLALCWLGWCHPALAQIDPVGPVTPLCPVFGSTTDLQPCGPTNPRYVGGFDSGAVTALGTVNSSSHAAGTSIGGLIAVPIARVAGGSGIITNFSWTSPGGATVQYVVRIWQKNPAGTTCTDQTAFVGNATDDRQLIVSPFAITPAAPANTTGDSKTYASVAGVTWDYKNADTSPGQNLYVCVMTTATDTADESSSPVVMLSGPQN